MENRKNGWQTANAEQKQQYHIRFQTETCDTQQRIRVKSSYNLSEHGKEAAIRHSLYLKDVLRDSTICEVWGDQQV